MALSSAPLTETLETTHIVRTVGNCGGKPRIDGRRIKVEPIAVCHDQMCMSADDIVNSHPSITLAQGHAALAYSDGVVRWPDMAPVSTTTVNEIRIRPIDRQAQVFTGPDRGSGVRRG